MVPSSLDSDGDGGASGAPPSHGLSPCELGDHGLGFEVVIERVVAHLPAPARLLVAAERHRGVEHAVAVDPHGARAQAVGGPVRLADIARPDPRRQAVARLVAAMHYVLLGTEWN